MTPGLAIIGHGKMGRLVEHLTPQHGFEVRSKFSSANNAEARGLTRESLNGATIAIEFSTSAAAPHNLRRLADLGVSAVCGTTGWYGELPSVRAAVNSSGTALVYGANFSIGVNIFLRTLSCAATLLAKYPEYAAWGWEIHHAAKKDAPSGTLLKLAETIRAAGYPNEVNLSSNRAGSLPGTHEIGFDSPADTITFRHTARSREGFALGALRAARWIADKKGVFDFQEIFSQLG